MPDVLRSARPSHSVAALGPNAPAIPPSITRPPRRAVPDRPFSSIRSGALCIGTGVGKITSYHVIEDHLDDFPLPVYQDERMAKLVAFADGRHERIEILVGDVRISPWRVDNFKPKKIEFLAHLRGCGACKEGKIGDAASHLIDAAQFHAIMVDLARKGITIYHQPKFVWLSNFLA